MDDQDRASTLTKTMLTAAGVLVVLLVVRESLGPSAAQGLLALALVPLVVYAYAQLTGRPVWRPAGLARQPAAAAPVVEDAWRSERWIAEAVARGLRALDEWRLEQRDA